MVHACFVVCVERVVLYKPSHDCGRHSVWVVVDDVGNKEEGGAFDRRGEVLRDDVSATRRACCVCLWMLMIMLVMLLMR